MIEHYNKLVQISNKMNNFFQDTQAPMLSRVLGKAIYRKPAGEFTIEHLDYFENDLFYEEIKQTALQYNVPASSLMKNFIETIEEKNKTTAYYTKDIMFVDLNAPIDSRHKQILRIVDFLNLQLYYSGYQMIAEVDSMQLITLETADSVIEDFFADKYFEQFQNIMSSHYNNDIPKEYFERDMYKKISSYIPLPEIIEIKDISSDFLVQNANYLAYVISETMIKRGSHFIITVNEAKLNRISYDTIELYRTITAYHWDSILIEAKKRGIPCVIYLQSFFDDIKSTVFQSFKVIPNLFGIASSDLDRMKSDYEIVQKMIKTEFKNTCQVKADTSEMKSYPERETSEKCSLEMKKYMDDKFSELFSRLDIMNNDIIEGNVNMLDEFDQMNSNIESVGKNIILNINNLDRKIYQFSIEEKESDLCNVLESKINEIKKLNQESFPQVQLNDNVVFMLAFLRHPDGVTAIFYFLESIQAEKYKENYTNRMKDGTLTIYTAESMLGDYMVYKKDSVITVFHLDINKNYMFDTAIDFFASRKMTLKPSLYFDDAIFEKFTELIKSAKKSIHIISPWISEYALNFYEKELEAAQKREVKIYIKYGYLSEGSNKIYNQQNQENFYSAQELVNNLNRKCRGLLTINEDDTHIKAVVIDGKTSLMGSCNIMSFHYNYKKNPDFRHEIMILVENKEISSSIMKYCEGSIHDVK